MVPKLKRTKAIFSIHANVCARSKKKIKGKLNDMNDIVARFIIHKNVIIVAHMSRVHTKIEIMTEDTSHPNCHHGNLRASEY